MTAVSRTRLWLGIGAFVLVQTTDAAAQATPPPAPPAAIGGGAGGEGGEAGLDVERAATDPVTFLTALDVMAAHTLAGRDAYAAGEAAAAGEMFVHPIAEVYAEIESAFDTLGVPPFQATMERASTLALERAAPGRVTAAAGAVLDALAVAEAFAPGEGATLRVRARVMGEMLDRAALQYAASIKVPGELEPYLDGYGFKLAAARRAATVLPALAAAGQADAVAATRAALAALDQAYPGAARPISAPVAPDALQAVASQAKLRLGEP